MAQWQTLKGYLHRILDTAPTLQAPKEKMKSDPTRRWLRASLNACFMVTGLAACADFSGITPQAELRDATSLGLASAAPNAGAPLEAQWWRAFGDETLNHLQVQALHTNPSLKLAQARLAAAQANAQVTQSASGPQLAAQLALTHQLYTANGMIPPPLAGAQSDSGTVQLVASWELDFFGKNQAALQAALGNSRAAQADAQAAQVLLTSQVAQAYFALVGLNEQHSVASRLLATREETRKLIQERFAAGMDTPLDVRQAEGSLPQARLQLAQLEEQIALTRNTLAALIGEPNKPLALTLPVQAAIKQVPLSNTINANLLGQRADIAAARWRVQAADSSVDNSKAQFYPDINLSAFAGFSSIEVAKLLQSGSQQWGVGPALSLPLFDSGRLRAKLSGKTAERDSAVESYNAALISAVHDVADQLASAFAIARQQTEQAQSAQAAQDAWQIAQERYRAGLLNALQALRAETAVLEQRRQTIDLNTRSLQNQVALARALGGGFTPASP
jgi:NodT family efflux transporter outer membrane factor (OMF) lipoprotein